MSQHKNRSETGPAPDSRSNRHYERTLQRLISIATLSGKTVEQRIQVGLVDLCRYLKVDFGLVCEQAAESEQPPQILVHHRGFQLASDRIAQLARQTTELGKAHRKTLQAGIEDVEDGCPLSPFAELGFACILTTPLLRSGQPVGALFFGSTERRAKAFTHFERSVLGIAAAWMEGLLAQDQQMAALRKSEERFKVAVNAASVGVWDWDLAADEVYYSPRLCEIMGLDPMEYDGRYETWLQKVHPDDHERVKTAMEDLVNKRESYDQEYRYLKDGSYVWLRAKGQGLWNPSGQLKRIAGSVEDVTQEKNIRIALSESEERLKLAVESAGVGIWDLRDLTSDRLWWADKSYELMGYEPGEVEPSLGLINSLVHPEDRERVQAITRRHQAGLATGPTDFRLLTKSSGYRWFQTSTMATKDKLGGVTRLTGTMQDIHVRKTINKLLRDANAGLRSKSEEMEKIMYIVSHDLKSPLVTINGFAAMIGESLDQEQDGEALSMLVRITRAASHMGALIDDILEVSRIGRVPDLIEPVKLDEVVADLQLALADATAKARCEWIVMPDLPILLANRKRLSQAIQNLITNALKYGCPQESNRVVIDSSEAEGRIQISVRDYGKGIAPENQERIFSLFQRLDSSQPGTGLGLAIVQRIMALYNGSATVRSKPGEGSVFTLSFPLDMSLS